MNNSRNKLFKQTFNSVNLPQIDPEKIKVPSNNSFRAPRNLKNKPPILWEDQLLYLLDEALDGLICEKERLSLALQLSHNDYLHEVFLFLQGESEDSAVPTFTQKKKNLLFQFDSLWWIRHSFNFTVSVNDFMQNKFFLGSCNDLFAMDERFFVNMSIQEKGKKVYHPFFCKLRSRKFLFIYTKKKKLNLIISGYFRMTLRIHYRKII